MMAAVAYVSEGVMKQLLRQGIGGYPRPGDVITVHCTGSLFDPPKIFWSTKDPGQKPFSFQVGLRKVIQGWDDGCLTMQRGEVARFTISSEKAYGPTGFPAWGIPPNATLVFDIEILAINGQ